MCFCSHISKVFSYPSLAGKSGTLSCPSHSASHRNPRPSPPTTLPLSAPHSVSVAILSRMMLHLQETSANRSKQTTGGVELTTLPWVVAHSTASAPWEGAHSTVVLDSLVCWDPSSTEEVEGRCMSSKPEGRDTPDTGRRDPAETVKARGSTEIA